MRIGGYMLARAFLASVGFALLLAPVHAAPWLVADYQVLHGDHNQDGVDDVWLRPVHRTVPLTLQYGIAVDVPDSSPNGNVVIVGAASGASSVVSFGAQQPESSGWSLVAQSVYQGDFDGDGVSDLLLQPVNSSDKGYAVSWQQEPFTNTILLEFHAGDFDQSVASADGATISISDVDGDGADDIVFLAAGGSEIATVFPSQGSGPDGDLPVAGLVNRITTVPSGNTYGNGVGAIEGVFDVSSIGRPGYSIPLILPPSRSNIAPALTLRYSGTNANSSMGIGWYVDGIPDIRRCPTNLAANRNRNGVNFHGNDRFCLNGIQLVSVNGVYAASGTEYRTEVETYTKIMSFGVGPEHFKVWHADGTIETYGGVASSRLTDGQGRVSRWHLSSRSTRHDASASISYLNNAVAGEVLPNEISFNGNKVKFVYEARQDAEVSHADAVKTSLLQRVDRVEMYVGGAKVRDYDFDYEYSAGTGLSRLTSITACGRAGTCLSPTTVAWDVQQPTVTFDSVGTDSSGSVYPSGESYAVQNYLMGDVNGDGRQDLVWTYKDTVGGETGVGWAVFLANAAGNGFDDAGEGRFTGFSSGLLADAPGQFLLGDTTGDGKADLVYAARYGSNVYRVLLTANPSGDNFDSRGYQVDADTDYSFATNDQFMLADVDGDGRSDLVWSFIKNDEFGSVVYLAVSSDNHSRFGFGAMPPQYDDDYTPGYYLNHAVTMGDINGDGKADMLRAFTFRGDFYYLSYIADKDGKGFEKTFIGKDSGIEPGEDVYREQHVSLGDVNGDGLADLVWSYIYNNDVHYGLSIAQKEPGRFVSVERDTVAQLNPVDYLHTGQQLVDFDGDNRSDMVYTYVRNGNFGWIAMRAGSDGESLVLEESDSYSNASAQHENHAYLFGDFTADGRVDMVYSYNHVTSHDLYRKVFHGPGGYPDHVVSITNGLGVKVDIDYEYLASVDAPVDFYTKSAGAVYPERDDPGQGYVVRTVTQNTPQGNEVLTYEYVGARTHLTGRGFLGFRKKQTHTQLQGRITDDYYLQSWPQSGKLSYSQTALSATPMLVVQEVYNHWNTVDVTWGAKTTKAVFLKDQARIDTELSGGLRKAYLQVNNYNPASGNLSDRAEYWGAEFSGLRGLLFNPAGSYASSDIGQNALTSITTNLYDYDVIDALGTSESATKWRLGFVSQQTTALTNATDSRSVVHQFTPYDADSKLVGTERRFFGSPVQMDVVFQYDIYGNVISTTKTGLNTDVASVQETWGAYINGLYPATYKNGENQTFVYGYDQDLGVRVSATDPNGVVESSVIDDFGRQVFSRSRTGAETTSTYSYCSGCPSGAAYYVETESVHPGQGGYGAPRVVEYFDRYGNVLRRETDAMTAGSKIVEVSTYTYDGLVKTRSRPGYGAPGAYTQYQYDILRRPSLISFADGSSEQHAFSSVAHGGAQLQLETITRTLKKDDGGDVQAIVEKLYRDSFDQVVRSVDGESIETLIRYDAQNNIDQVQVGGLASALVTMETDVAGNRVEINDPTAGKHVFLVDSFGNLQRHTKSPDSNPYVIEIDYDKLNRRTTQREIADGVTRTGSWLYDTAANGIGQLAQLSATDYVESYEYDAAGRRKLMRASVQGEAPKEFAFTSDAFNRPASQKFPDGYIIRNVYNAQGYSTQIVDVQSGATLVEYQTRDPLGNVTKTRYANGVVTDRVYRPENGNLRDITTGPPGNASLQDNHYNFDSLGNLHSRSRHVAGTEITETFGYDSIFRLQSATITGVSSAPEAISYDYDPLGNLTTKSNASDVNGLVYGENAGPHAVTSLHKDGQLIKSFGYNSKGFMTSNGDLTLGYNVFGQPVSISRPGLETLFTYAPDKRRVRQATNNAGQITETRYYADGAYEEVIRDSAVRRKITISGEVLRVVKASTSNPVQSASLSYLHKDHIGSVEVITDQYGAVKSVTGTAAEFAYQPFGERREPGGEALSTQAEAALPTVTFDTTTRGFTGHEHLDETGLIHMNGRVYDPIIGRFLTPDPYIAAPYNGQAYNRYSYVYNNPLSHTDATGEIVPIIIWGAVAAYRAYSAYDTVVTTIDNVNVLADENASTLDQVLAAGDIASNLVGGKFGGAIFDKVGVLAKSARKGSRADVPAVKAGKAADAKGTDANVTRGNKGDSASVDRNSSSGKNGDAAAGEPSSQNHDLSGDNAPLVNGPANALRGARNPKVAEAAAIGRQKHKEHDYGPGFEKEVTLPSGKRVDALNWETREVVELKPNNPRAIRRGEKQVEEYRQELESITDECWTCRVETYDQ